VPDLGFVQLTEAAHVEQSRAEAIDPYVGRLLLGALLSALLIVQASNRDVSPLETNTSRAARDNGLKRNLSVTPA
jgi:hypothetical protein